MAELGRDLVRHVNLEYPERGMATRESLSINAFINELPRTLQEAVV